MKPDGSWKPSKSAHIQRSGGSLSSMAAKAAADEVSVVVLFKHLLHLAEPQLSLTGSLVFS